MTDGPTPNHKAMATIRLSTSWEIWNERNNHARPMVILDKIKIEACLWVTAGAKRLGEIIPGE
jgi:hypothetical protein